MMPRGSKEKKRDTKNSPVSELSDDLLVEIISRVPYKSTCRCKCVSRQWRDLISHPDHRKKLPRSTLAGFFYRIYDPPDHPPVYHGYQSVSGNWCSRIVDPSLSFVPGCKGLDTKLLDCCNGLLLCRRQDRKRADLKILDYMVCNPVTERWVVVPATQWSNVVMDARLGFDPMVSSHFHVFEFVHAGAVDTGTRHDIRHIKAVGIYSSKAGAWTHRTAWDPPIEIRSFSPSAFFNGAMYLTTHGGMVLAVIDVEGNNRLIPIPKPHEGRADFDVYLSRGILYLAHCGASELSVWALEDSNSENWTVKHNVNTWQLFRKDHPSNVRVHDVMMDPEENAIFIVCIRMSWCIGCPRSVTKLMSYQMDSSELRFIHDLESGSRSPYHQYVPFFSESLADGH